MPFNVGETVGAYRILEQMGQGGMATVYKAYHPALDRYVALKVLHQAFLEDPNFLARFQREARLVARLDHANIVPIFDYAEHVGRPYLVMKFIEGETLKARLNRGPIPSDDLLDVVNSVGSALTYAHKHKILHRDIKPSNVLIAADGQIYLADFGLARIAQSGESTLTSDMIVGTPQYISPEQAVGKKDLDEGTDIYSFGVMLYELFVGQVPFSADTPFSIIHDHIYSPLPLPRQVNPKVHPSIERALLKALAKNREDRFKTVSDLVDAIKHAVQEADVSALDDSDITLTARTDTPTLKPGAKNGNKSYSTDEARDLTDHKLINDKEEKSSVAGRKVKKTPWMWIAAAILLFFCCLATLSALRIGRQPESAEVTQTQPALETRAQSPTQLSPLDAARQRVADNPQDPAAHLQLAIAYHTAGMRELVQEEIAIVERLAPNYGYLWDSSKRMAEQNEWLAAARLALVATEQQMQAGSRLVPETKDYLYEVVYKASKDPRSTLYISIERIQAIDEVLALVANARFSLFNGDLSDGMVIVDSLKRAHPDNTLVQLLNVEYSIRQGQVDVARVAIANMRQNPGVTEWILFELEQLERTLP